MSKELALPEKLEFKLIKGSDFISVKSASKLAGIHPVILEMGKELLKSPDGQGAVFMLATPEIKKRANEIEEMFKQGLKKVSKAFATQPLTTQSYREDGKITFWYSNSWSRRMRKVT